MHTTPVTDISAVETPIRLFRELTQRFDAVVGMADCKTVARDASMATANLCGDIGVYIDNPDTHTLLRFSPSRIRALEAAVFEQVTSASARVHFIVPGDLPGNARGMQELQPDASAILGLKEVVAHVQSLGIPCVFHTYENHTFNPYSEPEGVGADRYKGAVWVNKAGQLSVDGLAVTNGLQCQPRIDDAQFQPATPKRSYNPFRARKVRLG